MLEPGQEPVELVALEVQLGQAADGAQLGVEVFGLVEGPPVHLDGLVGAILPGEGLGQGERDLGVVGVDPHRAPQGVEPFLGSAELEAELGEELVILGVSRRGGQQVAAGLEGGVDPAQPRLQLGDARQVLGPVAAVDLGQPAQGVGGIGQVAGRLADAGRQRPGRDRTRLDLDGPVGGPDGLGELAVGFEITGQGAPFLGGRALVVVELLLKRSIRRATRLAAWSFLTRASERRLSPRLSRRACAWRPARSRRRRSVRAGAGNRPASGGNRNCRLRA